MAFTQKLCSESKELKVDPSKAIIFLILFCITCLALMLVLPIVIALILTAIIWSPVILRFIEREGNLVIVERTIVQKAMSFRYGFSFDAPLPEEAKKFKDFQRGNHKSKIVSKIKGVYKGSLHTIPFHYCHLHYTDKKKGINGKTEYKSYNRHYVFLRFPWIRGIVARSDKFTRIDLPVRYNSTLSEFNKIYKLTGMSEMICARFAKPVTILHIIGIKNDLECPNLSFSDNGWLCISFDNTV